MMRKLRSVGPRVASQTGNPRPRSVDPHTATFHVKPAQTPAPVPRVNPVRRNVTDAAGTFARGLTR